MQWKDWFCSISVLPQHNCKALRSVFHFLVFPFRARLKMRRGKKLASSSRVTRVLEQLQDLHSYYLDTKSITIEMQSPCLPSLPRVHDCQLTKSWPADRTRDWVWCPCLFRRHIVASIEESWLCFVLQFYRFVPISSPHFCMQRKQSVNLFLAASVYIYIYIHILYK